MRWSVDNPPAWLKGLPKAALALAVAAANKVLDDGGDEAQARKAALGAVAAKFEQGEDGEWQAKAGLFRFRAGSSSDPEGMVWEAVLIAPGLSTRGETRFLWTEDVLEASVSAFEGVDVCAYEVTADFFGHLSIPMPDVLEDVKRYLSASKVGWIEKAWWEPGRGVMGRIRFLPEQAWLPKLIKQGFESGNPEVLGLSIDSRVKGIQALVEGMNVVWPKRIAGCSSVDVVTHPVAGGKFIRALMGLGHNKEDGIVDIKKLLELIQSKRPDLLKGKDPGELGEKEIMVLAQQAMEPPKEPKKKAEDKDDNTALDTRAAQGLTLEEVSDRIEKALAEHGKDVEARAACGRTLDQVLGESGLAPLACKRIKVQFDGKVFERKDLDEAVKSEKDYLAQMAGPGFAEFPDQSRISGGLGSLQKVQIACDKAFGLGQDDAKTLNNLTRLDGRPFFGSAQQGLPKPDEYDGVQSVGSLRELYSLLTGDVEVRGRFDRAALPADLRAAQAIDSGTFSYVIGNTMARRLVRDYMAPDFGEGLFISSRKSVKDFRQQEAVNVGYFGDIADADPEAADYAEIGAVTDEESTYSVGTKGNILTISRKTIVNDDLNLIQRLVSRLGRAARRTHAKYVISLFTANGTCSDGTAWFTVGHGNLGTTALSNASALTAFQALAKMTEKDSGERIGLLDDPANKPVLIYPVDLIATAESIVNDDFYYSSNDLTTKTRNPLKGKITGRQLSLLTDATDWGLILPPTTVDMVEMGYLNGRQEPELFVADAPTAEQVFVADKIRYKIRHEYAGAVIDFRSGYKGQVAG